MQIKDWGYPQQVKHLTPLLFVSVESLFAKLITPFYQISYRQLQTLCFQKHGYTE